MNRKRKKGQSRSSALIILMGLFVAGLIGLVVLVLAGPSVGNTFSTISSDLDIAGRAAESPPVAYDLERDVDGDALPDTGGGGAATAGDSDIVTRGSVSDSGEDSDSVPGMGVVGEPVPTPLPQTIEMMRAGEIDDNAQWDAYMQYRQTFLQHSADRVNDVDVGGRHIITVEDDSGQPVPDAVVQIVADGSTIATTRTYADGRTLYFPRLIAFDAPPETLEIVVTKDNASTSKAIESGEVLHTLTLSDVEIDRQNVTLDVLFLMDATGSMSDEIQQLQDNLLLISDQINDLPGDVDVRFGLVSYRDEGDDYITQVHDFTPDVASFQRDLNALEADGGGDEPEALNEGLYDALYEVEWRGDNTIRLIFLVADAPPHLDYNNHADYAVEMLHAAEQGIKIHPIASSGLSSVGEYIFRQLAQVTMGHFIFLTYEGRGSSDPGVLRQDLEAGQGDYSVSQLDDLVLRLITDEVNSLRGQ